MKTYTSTLLVSTADTAQAQGSGDMAVLATPRLVALMENAAMNCAADLLPDGGTTVGSEISTTHLRPSAVGAEVRAVATLESQEGRRLNFHVAAFEGDQLLGEGSHVRYIVDRERFLSKL